MHTTKLYQKNSHGKIKFIEISCEHNSVFREWGILGGKTQRTSNHYKPINEGKANALTACEAAAEDYHRIITRKMKEGYTDDLDALLNSSGSEIDLNNLPTEFCCSKPITSISDKALDKLIQSGNARFFIKYNGLCHYILITLTGDVKIYTRRMDNHTVKYPELVQEIKDREFPRGTLLICELCIDPLLKLPHMTAFKLMSSISKSNVHNGKPKTDLTKNFKRQDTSNGGHRVKAAVFGVLFYAGDPIWEKPYKEHLSILRGLLPDVHADAGLFIPWEHRLTTAMETRQCVSYNAVQYEGLVVWDMTKSMEVTMNGKPKRRAAYKIKPVNEMDIIAFEYAPGKGKLQGKIGSLVIGKYDAAGNMIELGTVGSGLKPEEGDCDPNNWKFPCVIEIQYANIFPETGAFQFPVFVKKHEDKSIDEVESYEAHMAPFTN